MNTEIKIAICGGVRRGKDTVAKYLEDKHHMLPFAFGDELKKAFHSLYPTIPRHPKPVKGYQLFGQLIRYVHGDDYWVNRCFDNIRYINRVAAIWGGTDLYTSDSSQSTEMVFRPLITDLRQPNELARLREEGYTIIRVEAPIELVIERMQAAGDDFDESVLRFETEQHFMGFDVDYVITNYGTLDELYAQVDSIMSVLLDGKN